MTRQGQIHPDISLHARRKGDPEGPPLLLLHGITGSSRYWDRAVKVLGRDYHLYIPDLPGFGESPKPDIDYCLPFFVDRLRNYLEREGLTGTKIGAIGHSLGTLVMLEYLVQHPSAFDRMVLMSLPRHESREQAHRLFLTHSVNYRRILGVNDFSSCIRSAKEVGAQVFLQYLTRFPYQVVKDSSKFTLRSLLTTLESCLLDYRVDPVLEKIPSVPTLMIHGDLDMVAPYQNVQHLAERPNWEMELVRGTGHHVFLTHSRRCLDRIRNFMEPYRRAAQGESPARTASGRTSR